MRLPEPPSRWRTRPAPAPRAGPRYEEKGHMVATRAQARVEEIAQDLFEVLTHLSLAVPRCRRRPDDLKEVEFLTLALLHERGTMIVGDIQRLLGVLPAQMS